MGVASILFVCLGNICRSPLAEGIAKDLASKKGLNLKIDSAGTSGWHIDEPPCANSILIAKQRGIDISHLRGRKLNSYTDLKFDLVVAMDRQNLSDILRLGFSKEKVVLMGDFGLKGQEIPDPYHYPNLEGFAKIYTMLETSIQELFKQKVLIS
ncbi:low molecular weight protein-tyrosine-phosphatase [Helicobacter burdigaliensis]|uniref:low molecular weight protein-tyrosine-phosphatase n=1 Tax=Helicobacter burdigaliensis TaxID=2315334 RepID=UPI000EF6662C|nr:low molecular weight protein-tyrosine-phosphatase [Helicobacter burdigaliensis]